MRPAPAAMIGRVDPLGGLIAALLAVSALSPLVVVRASRIAAGEAAWITGALPGAAMLALLAALVGCGLVAVFVAAGPARAAAGSVLSMTAMLCVGVAADAAVGTIGASTRVSLAFGFWLMLAAAALLAADGLDRMHLPPTVRRLASLFLLTFIGLLAVTGRWDELSIMREYAARHGVFWREVTTHVALATGALAVAVPLAFTAALWLRRRPAACAVATGVLNAVQTIPSMALFGLLIGPFAWIATHVPGAAALGIRGVGAAPALAALVLYSLMPIFANTLEGLASASEDVREAARGMGLDDRQILIEVELPLALPVILAGIRIVLVQNIGLTTVAALIGGGGLGTFVFAGMSQTAPDLVLLGVVPIVTLCLVSSIVLDAAVAALAREVP